MLLHQEKQYILYTEKDQEISDGHNITWTLRPKKSLDHIKEAWKAPAFAQSHKPSCNMPANAGIRLGMAKLKKAVINLLPLATIDSIRYGM